MTDLKFIFAFPNYSATMPAGSNRRADSLLFYVHKKKLSNIEIWLPDQSKIDCRFSDIVKLNLASRANKLRHVLNYFRYKRLNNNYNGLIIFIVDTIFLPKSKKEKYFIPTVHDLRKITFTKVKIIRFFYYFFFRIFLRRSSDIISVSKTTAENISTIFKIDKRRIHILYNGVDHKFNISKKHINKVANSIPKFIFISRFEPYKNHLRLISAFSKIKAEYSLTLVGRTTPFIDTIRRKITKLQCQNRIHIKLSLSDSEMIKELENSNYLIFPSLYEGFGMPIIEAMAAGKTIICSDIPVHREIAGHHAIYFNSESTNDLIDVIYKTISGQELRDLKASQLSAIKRFSWDTIYDDFFNKFNFSHF